jgi:hypothetical protein
MRNWVIIGLILFAIALLYVYNLPPKPHTIKDLHPAATPNLIPEGPFAKDTNLIAGKKGDIDDKVQVYHYIIVESVKGELHAKQNAAKLKNDFKTDFIVLPSPSAGFYRISYGKYTSLEKAKSAINNVRRNIRSDAWIFSEKK